MYQETKLLLNYSENFERLCHDFRANAISGENCNTIGGTHRVGGFKPSRLIGASWSSRLGCGLDKFPDFFLILLPG